LHRGRTKLRQPHRAPATIELDHEQRRLLENYVESFNRRDWDALRRLIQADARIEIVGVTETTSATYFSNYTALAWEWKLSLARVDGEPLIVHWRKAGADWVPLAATRLWWRDGKVVRIRDYAHVDYLLRHAHTESEAAAAP
jgi:RNA polymerase sigma-70 factor (ECF subfamily)